MVQNKVFVLLWWAFFTIWDHHPNFLRHLHILAQQSLECTNSSISARPKFCLQRWVLVADGNLGYTSRDLHLLKLQEDICEICSGDYNLKKRAKFIIGEAQALKTPFYSSLAKNPMDPLVKFSKIISSIIKGNYNQQVCFWRSQLTVLRDSSLSFNARSSCKVYSSFLRQEWSSRDLFLWHSQ